MGPQISVKGKKIRELADDLVDMADNHLKPIETQLKNISIGFPAFGVIGIMFLAGHAVMTNQASGYVGDAQSTIKKWRVAMNETAANWDAAEKASTANSP